MIVGNHPAGQRFGHALDQIRRGAAQNEEAGWDARAVGQDAQEGKQVRAARPVRRRG
jgi:hypothetical protein